MEESLLFKGDEEHADLVSKLKGSYKVFEPTPKHLPMLPSEYS